jgi:hypothetical protein
VNERFEWEPYGSAMSRFSRSADGGLEIAHAAAQAFEMQRRALGRSDHKGGSALVDYRLTTNCGPAPTA